MSNIHQDHQQLSPTSPSRTQSAQKPAELWPAQEYEAPENQYMYGNGPYDGMGVAPTNDKEQVASTAHTVSGDEIERHKRKRGICGMPLMAFYALLALLALAIILGAVLGGVLGSRAANNRKAAQADPAPTRATDEIAQTTATSLQSVSTLDPVPTGASYSGPLRSDEWHYIFWPKNGTNITLSVNYNPDNITSFSSANNTFSTFFDNLHNGTRPMFGDISNTTQHWQFLEIPKSLKAAEGVRRSLEGNVTLYWIENRALGQNLRLTTDLSTSQDRKWLMTFKGGGFFDFHAVGMRVATDLNPAQWWYVGDILNGEDSPGDGWWLANAYTRTALPGGVSKDYYFGEYCGNDTESVGIGYSWYIGRGGCMADALTVAPWNIQVVEKITDDGRRV